jgi:outer membrane protein assembly factor BamB
VTFSLSHFRIERPVTKLPPDEHGLKVLLAFSVATGKPVWRYHQVGSGDSWGGTMTTAGGLVFFGDDAGSLEAVEARTGRVLWHFNTGQTMHASPMTFMVNESNTPNPADRYRSVIGAVLRGILTFGGTNSEHSSA